jgi:hypothetical protein
MEINYKEIFYDYNYRDYFLAKMKQFWVKVTNVSTTTGGGLKKRLRSRNNQNISLILSEELIEEVGKKRFVIKHYGRECYTTFESKVIKIREI